MNASVKNVILSAQTPKEVWELVSVLANDGNGYSAETILENVRAYAKIALALK